MTPHGEQGGRDTHHILLGEQPVQGPEMLIVRLGVWGLGVLQDLERQTLLERSPLYEQLDRDRVMLGWRQLQCCRPHFRMPRPTYMNSATASL